MDQCSCKKQLEEHEDGVLCCPLCGSKVGVYTTWKDSSFNRKEDCFEYGEGVEAFIKCGCGLSLHGEDEYVLMKVWNEEFKR